MMYGPLCGCFKNISCALFLSKYGKRWGWDGVTIGAWNSPSCSSSVVVKVCKKSPMIFTSSIIYGRVHWIVAWIIYQKHIHCVNHLAILCWWSARGTLVPLRPADVGSRSILWERERWVSLEGRTSGWDLECFVVFVLWQNLTRPWRSLCFICPSQTYNLQLDRASVSGLIPNQKKHPWAVAVQDI